MGQLNLMCCAENRAENVPIFLTSLGNLPNIKLGDSTKFKREFKLLQMYSHSSPYTFCCLAIHKESHTLHMVKFILKSHCCEQTIKFIRQMAENAQLDPRLNRVQGIYCDNSHVYIVSPYVKRQLTPWPVRNVVYEILCVLSKLHEKG